MIDKLDETAKFIADRMYGNIEKILDPIGVLTFVANASRSPIFSLKNPFDICDGKEERTDLAFEVTIDENMVDLSSGLNSLIAVIRNTDDNEIFTADVETYIDSWTIDLAEYNKKKDEFANHFLNEAGFESIANLQQEIMSRIVKEFFKLLPKEIIDIAKENI